MKYVGFETPGDPSVLRLLETPAPLPEAGEIQIAVEAAGVSRADALGRRGLYPAPPGHSPILGLEVAGSVSLLGAGVDEWRIGDRVCALCNGGGYAERVVVPAGNALPLPEQWSAVEGASLPENAFTAYDNLVNRAGIEPGDTLLIHGGSSGLGTMAIGIARALGARVFITAGSDRKCAKAIQLGAHRAINYKTTDFVASTLAYTNGRGVDIVLDLVGGDYVARDLTALATEGRIVVLSTMGGSEVRLDLTALLRKRARVIGSSLRGRSNAEKAQIAVDLQQAIWPLLAARRPIAPVIDSVFPFAEAWKAHERLESSEHIGKIVLIPV
ncbi:MAG: NAD(P)H-quinone oxidoreductase [Candidatus Eremiobacteraeota bacterium]|uniref:Putative quinone oxidoreductase n=1 Tax=mine drainage metagenome TaxID=410659 RepID=E6PDW7_9ZZZZ|nr:NAD(P)H-quinone oxidoreductase [Candidatus Eremiobacteraeota bacterium]